MLLFSIGFVADSLSLSFAPGVLFGGDDPVHMAYSLEVDRLVQRDGWPFDWVYMYGLGAPAFIFRPPGFHLTVEALHLLSFRLFPILSVHKFAYLLALSLYPAGIFYLLRKFRFQPLVCGLGALFAIAPISAWGHTIDAYYQFGLAKQAFAILAVPFFLGKMQGVVANREPILPGALLFGFMFINHPYMAWGSCLFAGLYFLVQLCSDWAVRATLVGGFKYSAMVIGGALLVSFWLFPFYSSPEIQRVTPYSSGIRHGFTVLVDTAAATVDQYLAGNILDGSETADEVFGHGISEHWGWKNQPGVGRWPVLSWGSVLGALVLLRRFRSRRNAFFLAAWMGSLILFLGPDDVPWLERIPFQEQMQYIHLVPFLELFAVVLAAIGVAGVAEALGNAIVSRLPVREDAPVAALAARRGIAASLVGVAVAAPLVFNVYAERSQQAYQKARTRPFEVGPSGQTSWSLRALVNRTLAEATDHLAGELAPFQRFYGSPTSSQASTEIFEFTLAPAYVGRPNLISPLFGGFFGGVNNLAAGHFRRTLWNNPVLTDLFQVDAVVTTKANQPNYPLPEDLYRVGVDNDRWLVYDRKEPTRPFHFTGIRPLLVVGDAAEWLEACKTWLRQVEKLADLRGVSFLAWEMSPRRGRSDALPLKDFEGIYLADPGLDPEAFFEPGELSSYVEGGGRIYCRAPLERAAVDCALVRAGALPAPGTPNPASDAVWSLSDVTQEPGRHRATLIVDQPGFAFLKTAFYRGWRVTVDGERQPNHSVSPGYNGVYVPAGRHTVEFEYQGANRGRLGAWVSGLTLLLLVGLRLRARRQRGDAPPQPAGAAFDLLEAGEAPDGVASRLAILPFAAFASILTFAYVEQGILRTPVPQYPPHRGEIAGTSLRLYWRPIPGDDVECDVQVARDGPEFQDLSYEESDIVGGRSGRVLVDPQTGYSWRVRCSSGGETHRWSAAVPFRTQ